MKVRSFIALEVPLSIREALARLGEGVPASAGRVRWVAAPSLHLTLVFLGEIQDGRLIPVAETLRAAASGIPPFVTALSGIGGFPGLERPRVVWVGVGEGAAEVRRLKERLDAVLDPLGFEPGERDFHPHLTLGRVKEPGRPGVLAGAAASWKVPTERWTTRRVVLFRSDLRREGPVYTPLAEAPLAAD